MTYCKISKLTEKHRISLRISYLQSNKRGKITGPQLNHKNINQIKRLKSPKITMFRQLGSVGTHGDE